MAQRNSPVTPESRTAELLAAEVNRARIEYVADAMLERQQTVNLETVPRSNVPDPEPIIRRRVLGGL